MGYSTFKTFLTKKVTETVTKIQYDCNISKEDAKKYLRLYLMVHLDDIEKFVESKK